MKKGISYILLAIAAAAALSSCNETGADSPREENGITFAPKEGVTPRALLTNATLQTNGNRIHVLDVLEGFTGTASWMNGKLYIDDDVQYTGNVVWGFRSGRLYPWTSDGAHQFFGWLSYDTALDLTADSFFGSAVAEGFSENERTLSLPALEMNTESSQFDFLYANTSNYLMPATSTAPVPLMMQHLFSAVSLQFRNDSQDDIIIHSVSISGFKNKKSAVINFVSSSELTTHAASSEFVSTAFFAALPAATRTLTENETYDLLARSKNTAAEYRLIWPQTISDLAPSDPADFMTFPITVVYEYANDEEHTLHTAHIRFPEEVAFQPGVRYAFTLLFIQKHIHLQMEVNPWNYELHNWSFEEQTISEVTELDFKENPGYDKPSKTCRIVAGEPVKGTFSVVNPDGAIWSIEPVGDVEYFTISPRQGRINSAEPNYEFLVIPNLDPSLDRSTDKKLRFNFHVQFTDGSIHDANTEINRDNWTVILPKN